MKKLRNKETGEIGNLVLNINPNRESYSVLSTENGNTTCGNLVLADYDTLAELSSKWEDYEEPNTYWCIGSDGSIYEDSNGFAYMDNLRKSIGNYFSTEEEAEKAVEKLKAWKRLKDIGFRVSHWKSLGEGCLNVSIRFDKYAGILEDDKKDLDLLFSGEDD